MDTAAGDVSLHFLAEQLWAGSRNSNGPAYFLPPKILLVCPVDLGCFNLRLPL